MDYTFVLHPPSHTAFGDEAEQLGTCKEWGLLSEKAVKMKDFHYKRGGESVPCAIVGYVDRTTAVIEFANGTLHCIHPSYLKEMQAASYGFKSAAVEHADAAADTATATGDTANAAPAAAEPAAAPEESGAKPVETASTQPAPPPQKSKGKKEKLQLPEEKVSMTATVQSFATVPNHFSDTDDEVVVYEAVSISEPPLELGAAWSSHSATLKKLELAVGDTIAFEAKVAAKKLTKHPVPYKINNPSKIRKL